MTETHGRDQDSGSVAVFTVKKKNFTLVATYSMLYISCVPFLKKLFDTTSRKV